MSNPLSLSAILSMCGQLSYKKGEAAFRSGKVTITRYEPDGSRCEAIVKLQERFDVSVRIDEDGDVAAACSCPTLSSYDKYCSHIAAVLLQLHDAQQAGRQPGRADGRAVASSPERAERSVDGELAASLLGLFTHKQPRLPIGSRLSLESRTLLDVTFICKPFTYGKGSVKRLFGIEMKAGLNRPLIVQQIRDFLAHIERGEAYPLSKMFTYDPVQHSFHPADYEIIRQLIAIQHHENLYRETTSAYSIHASPMSGERMLLVPPYAWEALLPALTKAPSAMLEQDGAQFEGIAVSDERLPLQFKLDQGDGKNRGIGTESSYQLEVEGLNRMTIMEDYGLVITDGGKLVPLPSEGCRRLTDLQQLLEHSDARDHVAIRSEQIEPFMERVIPGLLKLGSVHIAEAVENRVTHRPLKARLYLDRVRDRLLAGLEFHYGELIINPLDAATDIQKRGGLILVRDGERERRILSLMEEAGFAKTEAGYFMEDEEAEYQFLYHIVPQLEKLLTVHATSAVRTRIHTGGPPPKVNIKMNEQTHWLEFEFDISGIPETEIRRLLQSMEEKRRYHRLPNGELMPLETAELQEMIRLFNEAKFTVKDLTAAGIHVPLLRGLHLMEQHRNSKTITLDKSFRRLLDNLRSPDNLEFPVPDSLANVLRDYQVYGYQWMRTLANYHFGGILADDMGLGKTVQAITFLVSQLPEIREQRLPAIIVAPASVTYNWLHELRRFAPQIRAVIADGTKTERSRIVQGAASDADVIITSYPLLRRDTELYARQSFHTLILDEAQAFKNYTTQTAQTVKLLEARYRFALTGTPIENRLDELWSIFDAVCPGLFPKRREFAELTREAIAKRARPFLLRRVKTDVLKELPEKIETQLATELLPEQKKLYAAYLAKLRHETLKHLDKDTFQRNRIRILAGLTRLRQLCCHPALFVEDYGGSSAKFEQLLELIDECRSAGRRMLVFSQFTQMLGIIRRELTERGVPFFYLDGSTPPSERAELSARFNDGERELFLISLKAGGVGLNLTGADTVILYDLWWNPAVEQQAADRAYRIGQKNVVQVIRLVSRGTVEDKMFELQQRKKDLINEVIQPGEEALSALTESEIRELLMLGPA
ncbi:DEAD/DEAH box helicase [Paenibacillus sp. OV219]|uniref:DEAD/DEAH box helicase n=1 Tax=Paenibacillus sp. OV219 TaxID=1884377 RepID=UPI0008B02616|nr:DEAD/DEAH box helicase [Paenibacillus sp. OV219]SEO34852.1 Superfamily II DNA or RNA helicase, SNF2 family [Paenibacillus sp. OV219]